MCASLGALSAGGLDVVKEGLGLYINFMNPGDSAATFRSGGYMAGLTVNATAGTLDANIWRVQGLNGASMANPCYTASPPTSNNFYVGQYVGGCGALFFSPSFKVRFGHLSPIHKFFYIVFPALAVKMVFILLGSSFLPNPGESLFK